MGVFFETTLVVALSLEVAAHQMKSNTSVSEHSTAIVANQSMTASVTSKDGTTIGYRQLGHGPGLVILHGRRSHPTATSTLPRRLLMPTRFTCRTVEGAGRVGRTALGTVSRRKWRTSMRSSRRRVLTTSLA
jgi:hypothetical protein